MRIQMLAPDKHYLRLDVGESLVDTLTDIAHSEQWKSAMIQGIGALDQMIFGYFDLSENVYLKREFPESAELLNLSGNLTEKAGAPFWHLHATCCDRNCHAFGGHIFSARVSVTVEAYVLLSEQIIERNTPTEFGLLLT